jgi:hypothetical protein
MTPGRLAAAPVCPGSLPHRDALRRSMAFIRRLPLAARETLPLARRRRRRRGNPSQAHPCLSGLLVGPNRLRPGPARPGRWVVQTGPAVPLVAAGARCCHPGSPSPSRHAGSVRTGEGPGHGAPRRTRVTGGRARVQPCAGTTPCREGASVGGGGWGADIHLASLSRMQQCHGGRGCHCRCHSLGLCLQLERGSGSRSLRQWQWCSLARRDSVTVMMSVTVDSG